MGRARNRLARAVRQASPPGLVDRLRGNDRIAAAYRRDVPAPPPDGGPSPFLHTLEATGDLDAAAIATGRALRKRGKVGRLRTVAMALQRNPATAISGDVCRAL